MSTITDGTTGSAESQQLRASIEAQRAMLGRDLEALGDHVSPGRVVERRKRAMSTRMSRMRERVMGAADDTTSALGERMESMADTVTSAPDMARSSTQGNPLAMGLVSFGVGLVAASLLPASRQERHMAQRVEPMLERAADEAGSLARAEADQLMPKAKEVAMDLRDDATDAARVVQERATAGATEVSERARSGAEHVAQETKGSG